MKINNFPYENPLIRVMDFKILNKFIKEKTKMDRENISCLELGAGEGWFSIIAMSHGWICEAIDNSDTLDSINKFRYVKKQDFNEVKLFKNFDIVHSNMFQYVTENEIHLFFQNNNDKIKLLFISYGLNVENNEKDEYRVTFFKEEFFKNLAVKFGYEFFNLNKKSKMILCKKEVLNGS